MKTKSKKGKKGKPQKKSQNSPFENSPVENVDLPQKVRDALPRREARKKPWQEKVSSEWTGESFINGGWMDGTMSTYESFNKINPSNEKVLGTFPNMDIYHVELAVINARSAFEEWKKVSRFTRSDYMNRVSQILERRKVEVATVISLETGKSFNESIAEVNEALHMAQFAFASGRWPHGEVVASEIADKDSYMIRKPKGVVAVISPFNFPLAIGAFWCAAPALVEGNTVILKPSEDAPMTSQIAAEIYEEARLPKGVFQLLHGDERTGSLLVSSSIDHICFTGSAEVGQYIRTAAATSWNKTTSCEMGSKSACIVFDDVELPLALEAATTSAFKLSGQRCVSSSRILIQRSIYEDFCDMFVKTSEQYVTGNPLSETNLSANDHIDYGPLINENAFKKVLMYNDMVRNDPDAEVVLDSTQPIRTGYYLTPMVYKTEWRDVPYLKEEVFGPHVALVPFDDVEQAIRIYNDTDYGLAVGILTNDFRKARIMRDECDAGMIYWNGGSIAAESHLAFGGVKKSGNGFPSAARTFRAVTHEVSWTVNHADTLKFPQGMIT